MLIHLSIKQLAVVTALEIDFKGGMTVFTGETGAGKSILIEALGLVLGDRADSQMIRTGAKSAEISALYEISQLSAVQTFLREYSLEDETAPQDCLIRRVISREGTSKAFINGTLVSLSQLRALGEHLTIIHGQHQHQTLLQTEHQRSIVDEFAKHEQLIEALKNAYQQYQTISSAYQANLKTTQDPHRIALLDYQLKELEQLDLKPQEIEHLEQSQKTLSHSKEWIDTIETILNRLKSQNNSTHTEIPDVISMVYELLQSISRLKNQDKNNQNLETCYELFNTAFISLEESFHLLRDFQEQLQVDPAQLLTIENRLSAIYSIARKHQVQSESLLDYQQQLSEALLNLKQVDARRLELEQALELSKAHYQQLALELSNSRKKAALVLEQEILNHLKQLAMPHAVFKITIDFNAKALPSVQGLDEVEFQISLNPGLALQPLKKVSSGGELSRISLAIELITAQQMNTPTLVFDEADTGISGHTAAIVGQLLRKLGTKAQVFCVTHLPQVAAQGHQQYRFLKKQSAQGTSTQVEVLTPDRRAEEIARLLSGADVTVSGLVHAQAMLAEVV